MPKHKCYSVRDELAVVTNVKGGVSQASVSRDNGIPESTIRGWIKDEQKLRDFVDSVDSSDGMQRKKNQNCQRPRTTWQGCVFMVCEGETE